MNGALEILRRERDEAAEQIRVLKTRIRDLEAAIGVLSDHQPVGRAHKGVGDLKQIVLNKVTELAAGGTPKEIAEALTKDGRSTTDQSVSSTLSRLKAEGKVTNTGGLWFATDSAPPAGTQVPPMPPWEELDDDTPF